VEAAPNRELKTWPKQLLDHLRLACLLSDQQGQQVRDLDRAFEDVAAGVDDCPVALELVALPLTLQDRLRTFSAGTFDHLHLADAVTLVLTQLARVHPAVC
jgi:hypothetical protein